MRKSYPSDVSREQYERIEPILTKVKVKKTKDRELDLYEVLCAILYRMKNGCTWRAMPHDFPKWEAVYYYFMKWTEVDKQGFSTLDKALATIEDMRRVLEKRDINPSMLIGDSKSIQNADTAEEKGYDGAKKKVE